MLVEVRLVSSWAFDNFALSTGPFKLFHCKRILRCSDAPRGLLLLLITFPLVQDPSNSSSDAQMLVEVFFCLGSYAILHTKVRSPTPSQNYHKFISKLRQSHFKAYDNSTTGNSGGPIHTISLTAPTQEYCWSGANKNKI